MPRSLTALLLVTMLGQTAPAFESEIQCTAVKHEGRAMVIAEGAERSQSPFSATLSSRSR